MALAALIPTSARGASDEQRALAESADLKTILRVALAQNVELDESRARQAAAEARGRAVGRLPDPELKAEQWGVPLKRPYALDQADTLMVGLRQTLPAWGTRRALTRMAEADAAALAGSARGKRVDLAADVRLAWAEYARTHEELRLHREHVTLTSRLVQLARLQYQSGRGTQQDVLRLALELSRLHADIARIEQERRTSAALLNTLMNRAPAAPLGPPAALTVPAEDTRGEVALDPRRAELVSAQQSVERNRAALDLAERSARWPTLMLGLDYMYMAMAPAAHGYGAMVAISLPWFGGRRAEVDEAAHTLRASEKALTGARLAARYDLENAAARLQAARTSFAIVDGDLLPQARRALESAQAAFSVGQGDAIGLLDSLRSFLQVSVERVRAIARIVGAQAERDRAAGREVPL